MNSLSGELAKLELIVAPVFASNAPIVSVPILLTSSGAAPTELGDASARSDARSTATNGANEHLIESPAAAMAARRSLPDLRVEACPIRFTLTMPQTPVTNE